MKTVRTQTSTFLPRGQISDKIMKELAKLIILSGTIFIMVGTLLYFLSNATGIGKLPGDIHIKRENFSFHFPIVSCIVISIVLTVILNIFFRSK